MMRRFVTLSITSVFLFPSFTQDIKLLQDNRWSLPINLGVPLNTPDDNVYFMPEGNGKSGYYSIFNKKEGYGSEDIYKITFR